MKKTTTTSKASSATKAPAKTTATKAPAKTATKTATKAPAKKAGTTTKKAGSKDKAPAKAVDPKQLAAAIRIQKHARGYLARKWFRKQTVDKKAMEEEMARLKQAAYLAEVDYMRKQEAKKRKKDAEDRAKKARETKLKKDLLE
eukprot:1638940-Pyramimonas_sp.AAC.1